MVNILPPKARDTLRFLYYTRLLNALLIFAAVGIAVNAALLAPSYFLARDVADAALRYNTALKESLALKGNADAGHTMMIISEELKLLKSYNHEPALGETLVALTAHLSKDVFIRKILIKFSDASEGQIGIVGAAETRAELVAFVTTLQGDPLFKSVSLPVSNLTSEFDLEFSLLFLFDATPQ